MNEVREFAISETSQVTHMSHHTNQFDNNIVALKRRLMTNVTIIMAD